jgi:predicted DNA-binding ribbon-helix-helix protein
MSQPRPTHPAKTVERIQTGIRLEKRILKVLKGVAEYHDMYVGDLLEGICLHAFENKAPFSAETLQRIRMLKEVYHLDLTAKDSHRLVEGGAK